MPDDGLNARDAKLVQWLNEAYAKEAELEADLTAHIALTQKASYKKRLRQHLTETKAHKREVAARIKKLGGKPDTSGVPIVPKAVGEVAGKAVAAVKGQVGTARAVVSGQPETHLRNAQEELREEHVEIALYTRIGTFATAVGDRDTAQLAKRIIRDEERMAKFLTAELTRLVKELVRSEVPRELRAGTRPTSRRRSTSSRSASSRSTSSRSASSGSTSSGGSSSSGRASSRGTRSRSATASGSSRPRTRGAANGRSSTRSRSSSGGS